MNEISTPSPILRDSAPVGRAQTERLEKIATIVRESSSHACVALAAEVVSAIGERAAAGESYVLGLATGSTPVPFYRELIRHHKEEGFSFANVITFNLDEYYGLSRDHPESYYRFMRDQIFDHIDIPESQIHLPDGMVAMEDVYQHCLDYERRIAEAGGLDLQILGIGRTGHIGFNEPGSSKESVTRMITLDRVTRQDAAADFLGVANVPRSAITMGVGTILGAHRIVLMAWGNNKAEIVREAVEGVVTDQISASFLQGHENAVFLVDTGAASRLTRSQHPWLVGPVTWDDEMKKRAVIWLSTRLDKPILKLVDEDYNELGAGELLASTSEPAYEVNIETFNRVQHTITGWPGGKPGADDSRRPERAAPFPKKVIVLSPEPADAFIGMGGTLQRLVEQGHDVRVVFQTSGDLRVGDVSALNFARVLHEMADTTRATNWENQKEYAQSILDALDEKGEFGIDPELVRKLKGLILRGEARDAADFCQVKYDEAQFVDLPFYSQGRYRRFHLSGDDIEQIKATLDGFQPDMIFATGDAGDPSSAQAIAFSAFLEAWRSISEEWTKSCRIWLYRGRDQALENHDIEMAIPMSPDQLARKAETIRKFMSTSDDDLDAPQRNRDIAAVYDALGLAEYEAIEAFQRFEG